MPGSDDNIRTQISDLQDQHALLDRLVDAAKTEAELNAIGAKLAEIDEKLRTLKNLIDSYERLSKNIADTKQKIARARL